MCSRCWCAEERRGGEGRGEEVGGWTEGGGPDPLSVTVLWCGVCGVWLQVLVPGGTTETVLQQLLPDMPYNVGVVPLYADGEGPTASDAGKTRKRPPLSPCWRCRSLLALHENMNHHFLLIVALYSQLHNNSIDDRRLVKL